MGKGARVTWPLTLGAWLYSSVAMACDFCRPRVQAGIFNERFAGRLALTLMPLAVVLLLIALIVWAPWRRSRWESAGARPPRTLQRGKAWGR